MEKDVEKLEKAYEDNLESQVNSDSRSSGLKGSLFFGSKEAFITLTRERIIGYVPRLEDYIPEVQDKVVSYVKELTSYVAQSDNSAESILSALKFLRRLNSTDIEEFLLQLEYCGFLYTEFLEELSNGAQRGPKTVHIINMFMTSNPWIKDCREDYLKVLTFAVLLSTGEKTYSVSKLAYLITRMKVMDLHGLVKLTTDLV